MSEMAIPEPISALFLAVGGVWFRARRNRRGLAALGVVVALLIGPGVSSADQGVVIDDAVDLGSGLYSYTVRLVADTAAEASGAWDGAFEGPMNQVKVSGVVSTPSMTYASYLSSEDLAKDSHFLFYDENLTQVDAPHESTAYLGMGSAIDPYYRSQNFQFAQIVVAADESVTLSGLSADTTGVQWVTEATITGGQEAMCASWELQTTDRSVKTGQSVRIQITRDQSPANDEGEWWVIHEFPVGDGKFSYAGPVAQVTGSEFEFVPTEPGKYWMALIVEDDPNKGIYGGEIQPGPSTNRLEFVVTPEPASLALLAAGTLAILRRRRARRVGR